MTQLPHPRDGLDRTDHIHDLCEPNRHTERTTTAQHNRDGTTTWVTSLHTTWHPSLLDQLGTCAPANASAEEGQRPGYKSKPTANLEALDMLLTIDHQAASWVRRLGADDPGSTSGCLRLLNGLGASAGPQLSGHLDADVRRWWTWARIHTGWDSPAWKPDNTCPLCAVKGGLRVKLLDRIAHCVDCGETWDPTTIGLLADAIRWENKDTLDEKEAVG
jgi:hypothetical protein